MAYSGHTLVVRYTFVPLARGGMRNEAKGHARRRLLDEHFNAFEQDPAHRDSEPDLVFEDMTVMSDFELHCLCQEEQVSRNRVVLSFHIWLKQKEKQNAVLFTL